MTDSPVDASRRPGPPEEPVEPAPSVEGSVPVLSTEDAKRPRSTTRSVVEWVCVIGGALIIALVIRTFLFTTFWIPSSSMEPTLMGHKGRYDRVIVNRLSYKLHDVHRGDIVVFTKPPGEVAQTADGREVKDLIKRVVGLPGETITLVDGHVAVDGKALEEPYLTAGTETDPICTQSTEFKIPKDHVLVLGDNRTNSTDGRCFGPIDEDTIVGRAFVRFWPIPDFTWL